MKTKESTWQCNYFYNFYFKWGGSYPPQQEAENPENKNTYPIPNNEQQTIQIEDPLKQKYNTIFKPWDYRRGHLTKTALKRMYENISDSESHSTDSTSSTSPKKKKLTPHTPRPEKRKQRDPSMSPLTLRRHFLPRATRNTRPLQAHPAAAQAAAPAQAQLTHLNIRFESETKESSTSIRISSLTRFKPGFEEQTEKELAAAFHRPPRTYKEDPPFYPWLPPTPKVQFNLNYKD